MFKTVKAKILITSIIMLAFLMSAFAYHTIISRMKTKQLMVQNYAFSINSFAEEINDRILKSEDNLKSIALTGSLYYKSDRNNEINSKAIIRTFENYPETLGGGIWFKPYILDKSKKYACFYAYRDKNNKIVIDEDFASKEYDYPNQEWYKQIISQVTPEYNIIWSKPYFENLCSYKMMVTAGTGIYVDKKLVGIATVDWEINSLIEDVSKMKPLEKTFSMYKSGNKIKNSFALLGNINYDYIIATNDPYLDNDALVGHSLREIPWYADNLYAITYITYHNKKYVPFVKKMRNGIVLIICLPKEEMFRSVNKFYSYIVLAMLFIGIIIPTLLYYSMNRYIVNPIDKLMTIAKKISKGEEIQIKIEKPEEFAQLASTFDKMTKDIKLITQERAKINSELSIAKSIQFSSLPSVFPPFPDKTEFDIYASMEPAKEVGGDFYDFFFVDDDHLVIVMADVSGKGIPAALYMMGSMIMIHNRAEMGGTPADILSYVNEQLCAHTVEDMFVTVWLGIMSVSTGEVIASNAGHEYPAIMNENGEFELYKDKHGFVVGGLEGTKYKNYSFTLIKGQKLYLYTDGVTEATNSQNVLFGTGRMIEALNKYKDGSVQDILTGMQSEIDSFEGNISQFDDITQLCIVRE
ncbi:MAG: SpoIIE family protein phosphatase [Butyrivibrio sp.]|nr:SpoIIE family protein phosphatase [Butyrivibrio sp.]